MNSCDVYHGNSTRAYFYYAGEKMIATTDGNSNSSLQLWGADGLFGYRNIHATFSVISE